MTTAIAVTSSTSRAPCREPIDISRQLGRLGDSTALASRLTQNTTPMTEEQRVQENADVAAQYVEIVEEEKVDAEERRRPPRSAAASTRRPPTAG